MPPARNSRRRANFDAGPAIVDERDPTHAAAPAPAPAPAAPGDSAAPTRPRKFTALLDADTDARYGRLLDQLRSVVGPVATRQDGNGRSRAGYDPSRADLLRALLLVAEADPSVLADVAAKVRHHYGAT